MTSATLNLIIERNSDFTQSLLLKDGSNAIIDLTGYTFTSMIKNSATDSDALVNFTCSVPTPEDGILIISLTNTETSELIALGDSYKITTPLVYDIIQTVGSTKTRIVQGTIKLIPGVTTS